MGAQTTGVFGELLKEYRLAAGLTQEALAERAGVSARNIQNLERGENKPLKDTARRLAAALGLDAREGALLLTAVIPVPRRRGLSAAASPTADLPAPPTQVEPDLPVAVAVGTEPPAAGPRHNLPAALSSFIGREREQAHLGALLAVSRLVTLTGTGGVGKTRLALAVAKDLLATYPGGVWLVELAPLADPALLPAALAQVLGLREEPDRPLLATLTDHLREQRLLLVLDNCEHLLAACADLASALLRACPGLRLLATSREALDVAGEQRYRVPSLSVPDPKHLPPPELAGSYEAVRLFVERAAERREDFTLTPANAQAVAGVCARLDGVALAIELAAARVGSLSVEAIAARLDERFRLLTGGARDLPARQRTLRAALDWSWDLLGAEEQALLARLAVFAGGWTLEAAEAVCAGEGLAAWAVLDGLDGLVNRSLVQVTEAGEGEGRYRLLETVRQYGLERLAERAEGAARVRDRHLAHFLSLAEEAEPRLRGPEQAAQLARLEAEHDNLRAALGWAREGEDVESGLRLAGALVRFWFIRGHWSEGRAWLEAALAGAADGAAATRAKALRGVGNLAMYQGEYERAAALCEEALALSREAGDRLGIADALNLLGIVAYEQGEYERGTALFEEVLALFRALGDREGAAFALGNLGSAAREQGEYERGTALFEEVLALFRALGDTQSTAITLDNLGTVAYRRGEDGRAAALFEEALALRRAGGDRLGLPYSFANLGDVAGHRGEYERAAALYEEALALRREAGDRHGIARSLADLGRVAHHQGAQDRAAALLGESLRLSRGIGARRTLANGLEYRGWVATADGQAGRAARLGGAAEALREALGVPLDVGEWAGHERAVGALRAVLGEEAFAAAWAEGRALPLDEAVALALEGQAEGPDRCAHIADPS